MMRIRSPFILVPAVLALLAPTCVNAFAAFPDFIKDALGQKATAIQKPKTVKLTGDALLQELNLTSSTEPKTFCARPQQLPALLMASMPALFRLGSGVFVNGYRATLRPRRQDIYTILALGDRYQVYENTYLKPKLVPTQPLILYEFETCPFCRKVREGVSILGLTVTYRPCPKNGYHYRKDIKSKYGEEATFPFLMDPNTGAQMFESDAILEYLFKTYGDGKVPRSLSNNPLVPLTAGLGLLFRGTSGGVAKPSNPPDLPLVLWMYEGSPFCKLVRETLCELELEHTQISCPRGSYNRQLLFQQQDGRFQVPFLQDPNTGVDLYETEAIVEYLQKQYGVAPSPVEYL